MVYPHQSSFRYRQPAFWILSVVGVALALRTPGLTPLAMGEGVLLAAVVAWIVFRYTLWLVRIDQQFRDVNPYKIRLTTLGAFYGALGLGVAVLLAGAWLPGNPAKTPLENAATLLFVPALLASAAGALRGARDGGVLD